MSPAVLLRGFLRTTGMAVETSGQPGSGTCVFFAASKVADLSSIDGCQLGLIA